eukprot:1146487-Pelagomonas_calceolata.AAC.2
MHVGALLPVQGKPCLLALNKIDAATALPRSELDSVMGLPKLMDMCTVGAVAIATESSHLSCMEGLLFVKGKEEGRNRLIWFNNSGRRARIAPVPRIVQELIMPKP